MKLALVLLTFFSSSLTSIFAGEKNFLAVPGEVLHEYTFNAAPDEKWTAAKGKWEVTGGALRGSELEADHHGAVIRLQEQFSDMVIDVEFKFEGAKSTSLTINAVKDHMARIAITPQSIIVRRDDNDHDGPDKAVVFGVFPVDFKPGEWHQVHLEMVGDTMLGKVDDMIAWGSDPLFETAKTNPGFTAAGESVDIRNFTIRKATLNPEWERVKATLPKPDTKVPTATARKRKAQS